MSSKHNQLRSSMIEWVRNMSWNDPIAITMTYPPKIAESKDATIKHTRHFWNLIDKAAFGRLSKHPNIPYRCRRIMFIECGANRNNHHYHGVVDTSQHYLANASFKTRYGMQMLLNNVWSTKMLFNQKSISPIKIEPLSANSIQWMGYVTKFVSPQNADVLCTETTWLNDGPASDAK